MASYRVQPVAASTCHPPPFLHHPPPFPHMSYLSVLSLELPPATVPPHAGAPPATVPPHADGSTLARYYTTCGLLCLNNLVLLLNNLAQLCETKLCTYLHYVQQIGCGRMGEGIEIIEFPKTIAWFLQELQNSQRNLMVCKYVCSKRHA